MFSEVEFTVFNFYVLSFLGDLNVDDTTALIHYPSGFKIGS